MYILVLNITARHQRV